MDIASIVTDYLSDARLGFVPISAVTFFTVRFFLQKFSLTPVLQLHSLQELYYWYNVLSSLIHSLFSGTWCFLCFYYDPKMAYDLVNGHNHFSYALVAVSTGYFLYDFVDNVLFFTVGRTWEILFHHVVVITCFGIALLTDQYIGYAVVSLLVEINSVFLHVRQLLRLANVSPKSWTYFGISMANISTFLVFRLCVLVYMAYWVTTTAIPFPPRCAGVAGMFIMIVMNVILFFRLFIKDFLGKDRRRQEKPHATNGSLKLH